MFTLIVNFIPLAQVGQANTHDKIFGQDNILPTPGQNQANNLNAFNYTLAQDSTATAIVLYIATAAGNIRAAIYNNTGADLPDNLLVESASVAAVTGWNTLDITDTYLPAGEYWIGLQFSDDACIRRVENVVGTNPSWIEITPHVYGAFPDPYGVPSAQYSGWDTSAYVVGVESAVLLDGYQYGSHDTESSPPGTWEYDNADLVAHYNASGVTVTFQYDNGTAWDTLGTDNTNATFQASYTVSSTTNETVKYRAYVTVPSTIYSENCSLPWNFFHVFDTDDKTAYFNIDEQDSYVAPNVGHTPNGNIYWCSLQNAGSTLAGLGKFNLTDHSWSSNWLGASANNRGVDLSSNDTSVFLTDVPSAGQSGELYVVKKSDMSYSSYALGFENVGSNLAYDYAQNNLWFTVYGIGAAKDLKSINCLLSNGTMKSYVKASNYGFPAGGGGFVYDSNYYFLYKGYNGAANDDGAIGVFNFATLTLTDYAVADCDYPATQNFLDNIVFDGARYIYIAHYGANYIYKWDITTNAIVETYDCSDLGALSPTVIGLYETPNEVTLFSGSHTFPSSYYFWNMSIAYNNASQPWEYMTKLSTANAGPSMDPRYLHSSYTNVTASSLVNAGVYIPDIEFLHIVRALDLNVTIPAVVAPTNDAFELNLTAGTYKGSKTLLPRQSYYNFTATVTQIGGTSILNYVELSLNYLDKNVTLRWTEATDTFTEQSDPSDYVTLDAALSSSRTVGDTKYIEYFVTPNWNWGDSPETVGCRLYSLNDDGGSDQDDYSNIFGVEAHAEFDSLMIAPNPANPSQEILWYGYYEYNGTSITVADGDYNITVYLGSDSQGEDSSTVSGLFALLGFAPYYHDNFTYTVYGAYNESYGTFPELEVTYFIPVVPQPGDDDTPGTYKDINWTVGRNAVTPFNYSRVYATVYVQDGATADYALLTLYNSTGGIMNQTAYSSVTYINLTFPVNTTFANSSYWIRLQANSTSWNSWFDELKVVGPVPLYGETMRFVFPIFGNIDSSLLMGAILAFFGLAFTARYKAVGAVMLAAFTGFFYYAGWLNLPAMVLYIIVLFSVAYAFAHRGDDEAVR